MLQLLHSYETYDGTRFSSEYEKVPELTLVEGQRKNGRVISEIRKHVLGYTILWKNMNNGLLDINDKRFILDHKVLPLNVDEYIAMKNGMDLKQQAELNKYYNDYKKKQNELKH